MIDFYRDMRQQSIPPEARTTFHRISRDVNRAPRTISSENTWATAARAWVLACRLAARRR